MHAFREFLRIEKIVADGAPTRGITAQEDCKLSRAALHRWRGVLRDAGAVLIFPGDRETAESSQDGRLMQAPVLVEADQTTFVEADRETTHCERFEPMSETASEQYAHARELNEFAEIPIELHEGKICALSDRVRAFEDRVREYGIEDEFADLMPPQIVGTIQDHEH